VPDQALTVLITAVKYFDAQISMLHHITGFFTPENGPDFLRAGVNLKTVLVILHTAALLPTIALRHGKTEYTA